MTRTPAISAPAAPAAPAPTAPRPRDWAALAVLTLAVALLAVDSTVLSLAIPSLSADLAPSAGQLLWIGDIYSFILAGLLVTMGNVADRIGRRRLLLIGTAGFGVSSVLAALSVGAIVPLVYAVMAWRYVPAGDPDPADPPVHGTMGP